MKHYGLIGYPLSHSFSKKYFSDKFVRAGLSDCSYELYELNSINKLPELISANPELLGLNVTIPYKEEVISYLDKLDSSATKVGAVNVIKIVNGKLIGYNSDYFGFATSLDAVRRGAIIRNALVLGSGGASKAVIAALDDLGAHTTLVSRSARKGTISYEELRQKMTIESAELIVNTTPLGMYPEIDQAPDITYQMIKTDTIAFDLIYNPEVTKFLRLAKENGAIIKNGLEMLELQAEKSWEIWNA